MSAAMFCHTLRRRPSFEPILNTLRDDPAWSFLGILRAHPTAFASFLPPTDNSPESHLDTHDLTLPLAPGLAPATGTTPSTRSLRVLLLSPSSVSHTLHVEATLERIQRFSSATAEPNVLVFLLQPAHTRPRRSEGEKNGSQEHDSEGLRAYSTLHAALLEHAFPTLPILLLPHLSGLPDLLKQHTAALEQSLRQPPHDHNATYHLLALCASAMGNLEAVNYLHDTFTSIPHIAETCANTTTLNSSSPTNIAAFAQQVLTEPDLFDDDPVQIDLHLDTPEQRMVAIKNLAGEDQAAALLAFWKAEWLIDD